MQIFSKFIYRLSFHEMVLYRKLRKKTIQYIKEKQLVCF